MLAAKLHEAKANHDLHTAMNKKGWPTSCKKHMIHDLKLKFTAMF